MQKIDFPVFLFEHLSVFAPYIGEYCFFMLASFSIMGKDIWEKLMYIVVTLSMTRLLVELEKVKKNCKFGQPVKLKEIKI